MVADHQGRQYQRAVTVLGCSRWSPVGGLAREGAAFHSRTICLGRVFARLQFSDDFLKHSTHSLRRGCIDRSGIDEEIESRAVLADDL